MTTDNTAIIGPRWTERFLSLSETVAQWSKDPSLKCGAVVVNRKHHVVGLGYNGFPARIADKPEWLANRADKYPMVIHAEVNAILNATGDVDGCSIFVTGHPCSECAKFIVAKNICEVHYRDHTEGPQAEYLTRWAEKVAEAKMVFDRAGVRLIPTKLPPAAVDPFVPPFNMDEVDAGEDLSTPQYLRDLAERIFQIPTEHGVDQGDYDRLIATANHLVLAMS